MPARTTAAICSSLRLAVARCRAGLGRSGMKRVASRYGTANLDDEVPWPCVNGGAPSLTGARNIPRQGSAGGGGRRSSRFERPGQTQHAILGGRLAMTDVEEAKADVRQRPEATRQIAAALIWQRHATSPKPWIPRHAFRAPEFGSCCLFTRYVIFGENQFARFGQRPARNRTLQG